MPAYPGDSLTFIADLMLKKLAKYLRALGYDTTFSEDLDDSELLEIASREKRVLLTRDRALYKIAPNDYAFLITPQIPERQLSQLAENYPITFDSSRFLIRCLECNTPLQPVPKQEIKGRVPRRVYNHRDEFFYCSFCDQVFWRGDHARRMRKKLQGLLESQH